jgi:hypothetical protein
MGLTPSGGGWAAAAGVCVDQAQIIKAQTAIAGAAATPPRSDGVMGLLLNGIPTTDAVELDTDNPRSDLEFVTNNESPAVRRGLRVRANRPANAAAGDYPATGGETNPTLRTTGDKGLDVLLALMDDGYLAQVYARIISIAKGANISRAGLALLLKATGGLKYVTAEGLQLLADPDANNILELGAAGVLVNALASTSKRGLAPQATAPGAGLRNILAIDNGETAYKLAALFDATNPANLGTAAPGTAMPAARRDHVHEKPYPSVVTAGLASGFALSGSDWNTVLTLTAPAPSALVIANLGADLSPIDGRLTDDGGLCARMAGSPSFGCCMALVGGGSTINLDVYDDGGGKSALAAETRLVAYNTGALA